MNADRLTIIGAVVAGIVLAGLAASATFNEQVAALVGGGAGVEMPSLDDAAMIRRAAGHYDRVCARCHASPARPGEASDLTLSPSPPVLHERIGAWPPEVLFRVVKHGVSGSGMPAWPVADRDDEVWAMVAFLRALPQMDAATYSGLAGIADAIPVPPAAAECARCHGADGRGTADGAFPRLDIQSREYLYDSLLAFRDGRRSSGIMQSAVTGLTDTELAALADHFAGSAEAASASAPSIASPAGEGNPACHACHGPPSPARPEFPSLAGQYEPYLVAQLTLFVRGHRGGGPYVGLMHEAAHALRDEDIAELARFYAAMAPR